MPAPGRLVRRFTDSDRSTLDAGDAIPSEKGDIDAVVFSGGGARCFWQAGFWQAVQAALPRPAAVAAVSGGAALATILFAGGWSRFFPMFLELAASSKGNVQFGNLLLRRPVFPHPQISPDSFLHSVSVQGLRRLYAGPDLRIVISHPPRLLGAGLGSLVAAAVSEIEKHLSERLRVRWLMRPSFRTTTVRARDCRTPEELVHAIFQSSAAPPVFPVTRRDGRPALDGGLVENVPLSAVAERRRPLVPLSRHVRDLPRERRGDTDQSEVGGDGMGGHGEAPLVWERAPRFSLVSLV